MQISRNHGVALVREAAAVASAVAGGVALFAEDPAFAGWDVHPAWLGVLVLAARYGTAGLLASAVIVWSALAAVGAVAGDGALPVLGRLTGAGDLVAFGGATLVGWVSSLREARRVDLEEMTAGLEKKLARTEAALGTVQSSVAALRARTDRIDNSIVFWKDIAERLESGTLEEASDAAAELARIRTGARVALVWRPGKRGLATLGRSGVWSPALADPPELFSDRTSDAAVERRRLVLASELPAARLEDADVAMPVIDEDTEDVVAVLALRGIRYSRFGQAERADLSLVAGWLARRLRLSAVEPPVPAEDPPRAEPTAKRSVVWG